MNHLWNSINDLWNSINAYFRALRLAIEVLAPFERASKKFSAEKVPTGGLILPYYQSFKKQMAPRRMTCQPLVGSRQRY